MRIELLYRGNFVAENFHSIDESVNMDRARGFRLSDRREGTLAGEERLGLLHEDGDEDGTESSDEEFDWLGRTYQRIFRGQQVGRGLC